MAEQPSLWDQVDLLGLPGSDSEPAAGLKSARRQPSRAVAPPAAADQSPAAADQSLATTRGPAAPQPATSPVAVAQTTASAPGLRLPALASSGRRPLPAAPELILILDTETTALSPEQGQCIEVGAVLFHVPSRSVLQQISFLLPCQANPAESINGIPAAVTRLPQPRQGAEACFLAMVAAAEAVVAHNVAFDRQWFGHGPLPNLDRPWICSMEDIRWPAERQLRPNPSVRDLALAYGVPVWAAHRALTDCHYLVHVFERCPELEALLVAAQEPRQLYRARLSYAERHRAREAGFRWNHPVDGAWSRRLTEREAEALPFPVVPVESEIGSMLPRSA